MENVKVGVIFGGEKIHCRFERLSRKTWKMENKQWPAAYIRREKPNCSCPESTHHSGVKKHIVYNSV
jgi:hypothetical protein